jgi:hypothetical protein
MLTCLVLPGCRALGWSTLQPDDAETRANMLAFLDNYLQQPQYVDTPAEAALVSSTNPLDWQCKGDWTRMVPLPPSACGLVAKPEFMAASMLAALRCFAAGALRLRSAACAAAGRPAVQRTG